MSNKNNLIKENLGNIGKGILDSLKETTDSVKEDKSNIVITETNNNIIDEKSKRVNSKNSKNNKGVKTEKNKRSFMLNDTSIQQLKMLNLALDKDLSELIIEAIDVYYSKNEKKVEQILTNYFTNLKK